MRIVELLRPELVDHGVDIGLAGIEPRTGKVGMIGRVREDAGLQADGVALAIGALGFAEEGPVHEVAGIELDSRRGDAHFHYPARARLFDAGRGPQSTGGAIHDEVMVIAAAEADLLVARVADAIT